MRSIVSYSRSEYTPTPRKSAKKAPAAASQAGTGRHGIRPGAGMSSSSGSADVAISSYLPSGTACRTPDVTRPDP